MYSAGIKAKKATIAVLAVILAALLATIIISSVISANNETVDYYEVKVGNSTFATVATEEEAAAIIDGVREYYLKGMADAKNVDMEPVMTIKPRTYKIKTDTLPELATDTDEVIEDLVAGRTLLSEYTIQSGDSMEQVTGMLGCTEEEVVEQNESVAVQDLEPGTQVSYTWIVPYVEVKAEQFVECDEVIPYETVYQETDSLLVGEEEATQQGSNGLKHVTYRQAVVNGEVVYSEVYSEEVITEPVSKVVLKGTKQPPVTSASERERVVNYALQFVGNPYVYGGTSLTNGCDCSGFIYRVFQDCGYTGVPRVGVEYVYQNISASELQPGDVTVYGTHYALYIGNGMEVSAVNESQGIRVHPMYYSNSSFVCGVRIIPL